MQTSRNCERRGQGVCKDSYSHGFYYVIGLVTLNRPRVHCLPYILHLSSYFPRLSIVLPHNHPSSLNRKGFEGLVRLYDKHEKIRPRKSYIFFLLQRREETTTSKCRNTPGTKRASNHSARREDQTGAGSVYLCGYSAPSRERVPTFRRFTPVG